MSQDPSILFKAGLSRRNLIGSLGAGALMASGPLAGPAWSQTAPATTVLNTKKLPRSDEALPAIGLGTYLTFDVLPGRPRTHLGEVMKRFWDGGGRVVDTSPLYGMSEISVGDFASAMGITDQLFVANKVWTTGEYLGDDSHARRSLEQSRQRLWRDKLDVMQVHSLVNVDMMVPLLNSWKDEGRIRFVGVTHHELPYFAALANWVERGPVDFVQVHYSIHTRQAEERILKAAADRGIAVLVNMPFEKARLFKIVEGHTMPDFARGFADNWAQFFLKWVISHPTVTCAIPATTNPDHMSENIGALTGPLPDPDMRVRMVRHMETVPGFEALGQMPSYPGKTFIGAVQPPRRPAQPAAGSSRT
jgi:diketogulonate reductase-like aldo/keto reductase